MHLLDDRRRQMAAIMFASLMLHACGSDADTNSTAALAPSQTGLNAPVTGDGIGGGPLDAETEWQTKVGDTILFATDAHDLSLEAQAVLKRQAQWLLQYPARTATVQGHADERGTREYNLALGERRAESARAYLVALGVDATRLQTISFGKEQPVCNEVGDDCWQRNRRSTTALNP